MRRFFEFRQNLRFAALFDFGANERKAPRFLFVVGRAADSGFEVFREVDGVERVDLIGADTVANPRDLFRRTVERRAVDY